MMKFVDYFNWEKIEIIEINFWKNWGMGGNVWRWVGEFLGIFREFYRFSNELIYLWGNLLFMGKLGEKF